MIRVSAALALGLAGVALAGSLTASAATGPAGPLTALPASSQPTTDQVTGTYRSSRMSVEVALAPRNAGALNATLAALYNPRSSTYQHWLAKGQFDARFAPSQAARAAVTRYLTGRGLTVQRSESGFLLRATGSSDRVTAAFGTTLRTYRDPAGTRYFANASAVRMPSSLAPDVLGVIGLSDTLRMRSAAKPVSCQLPYPTLAFFTQEIEANVPDTEVPRGYGGGPGCSGLTPEQGNSLYGAPDAGPRGKGARVTLALFELSAYQPSDIAMWARTFYGPGYTPPISAINVDGGPVSPACPAGDECVPGSDAYYYDVEPVADIDTMLMISPDARNVEVYDAPNDELGITTLDEYGQIANDDSASVVSSSWGICENDSNSGYELAENTIFQQMAAQGQSMFAATGDTGAFGCIRNDGTTAVNVWNPASQPWVTAVGGTSFGNFNPGSVPHPFYPYGTESVWNTDSLCNASAAEGPLPGYDWCALTGAGGGGSSQFFGRPSYQAGPGVTSAYTTTGCALTAAGTPCREVPDVSADADPFTGFAEYCTGNSGTPGSYCATFSGIRNVPGWFGDGGTSVATPLWASIIADRDSYLRTRTGNANPLLYHLFDTEPRRYFNDITGAGQAVTSNGLFPVTPGYDEATGMGTPKMAQLITGSF